MLLCMRTTLNINDTLLQSAKRKALESNTTLTSVVEDALRLSLAVHKQVTPDQDTKIPTSGKGGLLPGVDLDDTSSLIDIMEGRG